ncbi:mucin-2 [Cydia pomonella]|uniref:mucin-2 n=1 Tax=Cydia pomonella TaxID=82600 RepID=UPI002ADE00AF|nr:mucin-2 [Cydia pomonella]
MDRRCAAGALLALAACIATTAAAPTASNQTALDLYEGASEGCYYNFQHYGEGDRIMTNEPCLNCTCHNRMLMCYLRVCPFTKPIGQDCSVEKRADQCCPIVTCPDVPVDLLTSTSTSSPSEYGETGLGKLDRYGCSINGKYFPEGSKVPPSPNKPCEHCYCIRNMTTCVMQECTLHVDGCTPIYRKDVCCPVRYSCDHPEDEIPLLDDMTTTVRPTPGFLLTTTTLAPVTQMTQDCVHDDKIFADGALIKTEKACEHCYCMKGDIVCVVQECGTPMENEGKNCTSMPPREGQCCPDTYICEGDEMTTEMRPDIATVTPFEDITTLSPPRRVNVEGSGYRSETDEPSTEVSPLEPDTEGSGEEQPFKPTYVPDMLLPESETSHPLIVTDQDEIPDHYSPGTTEVPETEPKITEKTTTEADKGENTVPSGDSEEEDSSDKTSPETTTTKLETEKESSYDAKTTVLPEGETFLKEKTTPHEEITVTEPAIIGESTIADHELHSSPDSIVDQDQLAETTIPTRRKEEDEMMPQETTTLKHFEESTTKASDIIVPDVTVTESTTSSSLEQEIKTTTSQLIKKEKEVKETTTESYVELTTEPDVIKTHTQTATTIQPEIATEFTIASKVDFSYTTSANPIENEIDEELFPTLAPGRIPGEGDCLLDGVTYSHESIVPSSSHCHTTCRCVSSIVKCEPIVCSPPPDYMDNCQPMYDSPESCCPTYVCDHPRETVPPQSHSQMAGTESPIPTPTIECDGDQCKTDEDKKEGTPSIPCTSENCASDSYKKPDECGSQGCGEVANKPEEARPAIPTDECNGDICSSSPEHCASGKCETEIPKDHTCNDEHGCEIPVIQTCQGVDCATQPDVTGPKEAFTPCDNPNGCKDQTCNNENGCDIPVVQTCQGDDCAIQPDITASKDESTHCDNPDGCEHVQITEKAPPCTGESCVSELPPQIPQDSQDCMDGSDCSQSNQTPITGECNEEECKTQQVPEINEPPRDCIGTKCIQEQDHVPHITDIPERSTESVPRVTELPEEPKTKSEEPVTELPKTTAIEKEIETSAITKPSPPPPEKGEESDTTPQYDEIDDDKEKETTSTISKSPEIVTQTTEGHQEEVITESANKETTMVSFDITKVKEILPEETTVLSEVPTTEIPSLSDKDTKETVTELPSLSGTELPEPTLIPISDKESEVPEDAAKDKDTIDITTTEGTTQSSSPKITEETTKSPEMLTLAPEILDRDGHAKPTKEPEYVQDTEETITETTEHYTSAPEQITEKVGVEPIQEQESQGTPTTPKTYEDQTTAPEILVTASPEPQSTSTQDEDIKLPELPLSTSTPEELVTSKPHGTKQTTGDISLPDTTEIAETPVSELVVDEITSKPEDHDLSENVTPGGDEITKAPAREITGEPESPTETPKPFITLPQETSAEESDEDKNAETPPPVIVDIQTQTPMSIVKDHGDDEFGSTVTPEPAITTEHILESESPDSSQSPQPTSMPAKKPSEESASDVGKMPTVSDEDYSAKSTESPADKLVTSAVAEDVLPTEKPVDDSYKTSPETETSTGSSPVSIPIVNEQISSEPSVTEANLQESSSPQEETSDNMETKSPTSVPESSVQSTTEGGDIITSSQEQSTDNEDVTELPELIVHEHPTESSSIEKESEQPVTEEAATKEPQEIIPETVTSDVPIPQGALTITPEIPESVSQTEKPDQESITKAPEIIQPETTESKLDEELSHIPESSSTEAQKEEIETPATQVTITSAPKVSETEPQELITDSQPSVTETDLFVTQPHKDTTEAPESNDMVTKSSDSSETNSESQKESPAMPEEPEIQSHTETTKTQDVTTTVPEVSLTESHKESTETPKSQDTATKEVDISPDKSDQETTEEPKPHDAVTSAPEVSETETQGEITKAPEVTDVATEVPETPEMGSKDETTEAPVVQDLTTSLPELPITETVPIEDTKIPMIEEMVTVLPEMSGTVPSIDGAEGPTHDDTSSDVPEVHATGPQKEVTHAAATEDTVTNVPETFTESHQHTQAPESQDTATSSPELPETKPKTESTGAPELQETSSTIPETSTEPKKEITELPETQGITDTPEISADTTAPETEPKKEVTELPETQGITDVPEISADTTAPETEPKKEITEIPETQGITDVPETSADTTAPETEPKNEITELPETQGNTDAPETSADTTAPETEPKKEITELPETQGITDAPEISADTTAPETGLKKEITELPETQGITDIPEISADTTTHETELKKEITELPETQGITDIPEISADTTTHETELKKEITELPETQEITDKPEISAHTKAPETEPEKEITELPETQGITDAPDISAVTKVPETEPKKEMTELPETQVITDAPEISADTEVPETEPKKEITELPETQGITEVPEISSDTKTPEKSDMASPEEVTKTQETQTVATNAPVSETEVTETPESLEKTATEPHDVPTEPSDVLESQKPATELPEISSELDNAPEILATESDKEITEAPKQEFTTKMPEPLETEPAPEKSSITEKDESVTDSPIKITTTPTESSKLETETLLTTEVGSTTESDKKITESQATEHPVKVADSDSETEKPHEVVGIETEIPFVEPAQTESPVSGSIESETKAPEFVDTELGATVPQELPVTEKQDSRRTEPTSAPVEEDVTKAPETLETPEKTTIVPEEVEQTTKEEYTETTPDLVLLEEHTHKTVSPDVEAITSPSDIPLKEYEPSTSEISIEKVTESVLSTESEKSPQEDVVSDKDQSVPEVKETTIPEKSTEPLPGSEEITTISPLPESVDTGKPHIEESNEISTSAPTAAEQPTETEKPLVTSVESESDKPQETITPEEEFILATTKATTIKAAEQSTTLSPLLDKFGKPDDEAQKPAAEPEKSQPDVTEELPKPGANEVQPTEEALPPEEESHFPPSGTSGYGQEPDYGEEDSFGPGTCRYGGKVYVSAQQIPRDDPCDFCFCFRSDIICLQQSCPPPIHGCHEEPIQGFCCPRYECPVSMATTLNVTTTTTTTTTTLPPHFLPHAYKGAAQRRGCQIKGHTYKVGEVVRASSGPCLHCTCGGDGQMKCDPKVCTPEPMLRQMIAAAVSAKRRR